MKPHRSGSKPIPVRLRMKCFSALALAIVLALSWFLTEGAALADKTKKGGSPGPLTGGEKQIDMSELPMFARLNPPPPNLMFIVDDSGRSQPGIS